MRSVSVLFVAVVLGACGGDGASGGAPTISNLTLGSSTVSPGGQITGTLHILDPDGLGGMSVTLDISGPAAAKSTVPVQGASDALTEADVPFVVLLAAAAPTGAYTVKVTATDGDGNTSNTLTEPITVQ